MSSPNSMKIKTVEDLDLDKYKEKNQSSNPYHRKFGSKKKSYFSVVS